MPSAMRMVDRFLAVNALCALCNSCVEKEISAQWVTDYFCQENTY